MMGAIRIAFRVIWENDLRRTFVQSKLLDFVLVLGVGVVAVAALGGTLIVHVLAELGRDLSDALGYGTNGRIATTLGEVLASGVLTLGILVVLFRFVPPVRPPVRAIWLPALLATAGFHIATAVYALYLGQFADITSVYGPLGAVLGFLLVVYVGAIVILLGAELVAAWPARCPDEPPAPPHASPADAG
jgi:membrane protein